MKDRGEVKFVSVYVTTLQIFSVAWGYSVTVRDLGQNLAAALFFGAILFCVRKLADSVYRVDFVFIPITLCIGLIFIARYIFEGPSAPYAARSAGVLVALAASLVSVSLEASRLAKEVEMDMGRIFLILLGPQIVIGLAAILALYCKA